MKMRELLTDESRWTKDAYARDKDGKTVSHDLEEAYSFCLVGAMFRCYNVKPWWDPVRDKIIEELRKTFNVSERSSISITLWNDKRSTTFADVKALVDKLDI